MGSDSSAAQVVPSIHDTERYETPSLISPPRTRTPPTIEREPAEPRETLRANGEGFVDSDELAKALENESRRREHTPGASPSRKRQRVYGDRYGPFMSTVAVTESLTCVDSFQTERDVIYRPASVYCTTMPHPPRRQNPRSDRPTTSFISKRVSSPVPGAADFVLLTVSLQPKQLTAPSRPCSAPKCLTIPFPQHFQTAHPQTPTLHGSTSVAHEHLQARRLRCLRQTRLLRPRIRTSSPTLLPATTLLLLDSSHLRERHQAGAQPT